MDFKKATDTLFERVSHEKLAEELGVSVAAIRQARLDGQARAHRSPPKEWQRAIIDLAEARIRRYRRLIGEVVKSERAAKGARLTRKFTNLATLPCLAPIASGFV